MQQDVFYIVCLAVKVITQCQGPFYCQFQLVHLTSAGIFVSLALKSHRQQTNQLASKAIFPINYVNTLRITF